MSAKLTPHVGDRVRLVHKDGAELAGEIVDLPMTADWNGWAIKAVGAVYEDLGWTVAEILAKPFPPAGTFVQGDMLAGIQFRGVVTETGEISGAHFEDDEWHPIRIKQRAIKSWEVIS